MDPNYFTATATAQMTAREAASRYGLVTITLPNGETVLGELVVNVRIDIRPRAVPTQPDSNMHIHEYESRVLGRISEAVEADLKNMFTRALNNRERYARGPQPRSRDEEIEDRHEVENSNLFNVIRGNRNTSLGELLDSSGMRVAVDDAVV